MNWKFWQKPGKEEDTMGMYLRREETPEQAWRTMFDQAEGNPDEQDLEETPEEPEEAADPLAGAAPEIQAAVEARLAAQQQTIRASLARQGIDLTADLQPAIRDPRRAQQWLGVPEYQAPPPQQQQPAAAQQAPPEEADEAIPDPQYDPGGYRRWLNREVARATQAALAEGLKPLQEQLQETRAVSLDSRADRAVALLAQVADETPWLQEAMNHPEFESYFRQGLQQIDPKRWATIQDLKAVTGMVVPYLPPLDPGYAPEPQYQQRPARQARAPQQPPVPPRNEQGRFVPNAAAVGRAAIGRAAAEQTAPSRAAGRAPQQQQYEDAILQAAARMQIPVEEAQALMKDSTGDAAEQMRRKRLGLVR